MALHTACSGHSVLIQSPCVYSQLRKSFTACLPLLEGSCSHGPGSAHGIYEDLSLAGEVKRSSEMLGAAAARKRKTLMRKKILMNLFLYDACASAWLSTVVGQLGA